MDPAILLDGHVHFHACFAAQSFFDAAKAHFDAAATELGLERRVPRALLYAETSRDHYFRSARDAAERPSPSGWSFRRTAEQESVIAERADGARLFLIAGRQVATREGLEVLALTADREFDDGRDLDATIADVESSGAVPVIPWGFGKWTLRRRSLVEARLSERSAGRLFLGDNGGRPGVSRRPRLFEVAAARGIWTIPGSDPLPFPSQVTRVGGYGCVIRAPFDEVRPAASLARALRGCVAQPQTFGRLEKLPGFCLSQIRMQWHKRFGAAR